MAAKPGTTDTLASYMTTGYFVGQSEDPRHWDTSSSNVITVNLTRLNAEGQAAARAALAAWEMVADIDFRETTGTADITFDDNEAGADTDVTYDPNSGEMISANIVIGTSWLDTYGSAVGTYGFQTYMHEIGHALGLGHTGAYDGGATYANATWTNDSWQQSVMSYLDQDENPNIRAGKAYVVTPMMADVVAIQSLYGAPTGGATAGDTAWGVGANLSNYMTPFFGTGAGSLAANAMTIYDEGGTDTLNVSDGREAQTINLTPGTFSSTHGQVDNIGIARNTTIEKAIAGSGADSVTGNNAANVLKGNGGTDGVYGGTGKDSLYGGDGDDKVNGGTDADRLYGDAGQDRLDGGSESDSLYGGLGNDSLDGLGGAETIYGGDGLDTAYGGSDRDQAWGEAGDDAVYGGDADDSLYGGDGADKLYGDAGNDSLAGGSGSDRVSGGSGNDRIGGGSDADTLIFSGGRDVATDFKDNEDTIQFDDAVWGGGIKTAEQLLLFAEIDDGDALFDFGDGDTLRIEGVTNLTVLLNDLTVA